MNNTENNNGIGKKGTKLQIRHYRYVNGGKRLRSLINLKRAGLSTSIAPRGGATTATLYRLDGGRWKKAGEARADCSARDNFCRRIGKDMALGRLTAKVGPIQ